MNTNEVKQNVMSHLEAAVMSLNRVQVSGKQNLLNLGGGIDMLERIAAILAEYDLVKREDTAEKR